jgi:hypothetical protein
MDSPGSLSWDDLLSDLGWRSMDESLAAAQPSNPPDNLPCPSGVDQYFAQTAEDFNLVVEDE